LCSAVAMLLPTLVSAADWTPYWAAGAHGFAAGDSAQHDSVYVIKAPDEQSSLRSGQGKLELLTGNKPAADLSEYAGALNLIEANWSDDSRAVFVNTSDGGDAGTWTTHVFVFDDGDSIHELPVEKTIVAATKLKSDCIHNVGAAAWLEGHKQLLVVEQVPVSGCADGGATAGYVLDTANGTIARTLTAKELKSDYAKYLGESPKANMVVVADKPDPKEKKSRKK